MSEDVVDVRGLVAVSRYVGPEVNRGSRVRYQVTIAAEDGKHHYVMGLTGLDMVRLGAGIRRAVRPSGLRQGEPR